MLSIQEVGVVVGVGCWYVRMLSIQEVGVVAIQFVRMVSSGYVSDRKRLGLSHPIWLAYR
jgi:hypothetical protein